ncbi:hypothetical protein KKHLCK_05695 [Candidatus Electrothrix laxa]
MEENKKQKGKLLATAAKGSMITMVGGFLGKALSLLLRFLIIRLLGAKYFGLYAIGTMTVELIRIIASIGLPRGGMRFVARSLGSEKPEQVQSIIFTSLVIPALLSLVSGVALFYSADLLAGQWYHTPELAEIFKIFAWSIPCLTLLKAGTELSRGFFTTRFAVLAENIVVPVLLLCFFAGFYLVRHDFISLLYAYILANALGAGCGLFFLYRQLRTVMRAKPFLQKRPRWSKGKFNSEVVRYSLPLFLSGITGILMNSIDIFMLGRYVSADQVGIYAAASMIAVFLLTTLIIPMNSMFAPLVAGKHGSGDITSIHRLYVATTRWMFFFATPPVVIIIIGHSSIMAVFGQDFIEDGGTVLQILILGHFVNCLTGGVGQILSMAGHPKKELFANILVAVLNISLNVILIPRFGLVGAAAATSSSLAAVNLLRVFIIYNIFKIQPFTKKLVVFFIGTLVLVMGTLFFAESKEFDLLLAGGAGIILTGVILAWLVEEEDRELMKKFRHRLVHRIKNSPPKKVISE